MNRKFGLLLVLGGVAVVAVTLVGRQLSREASQDIPTIAAKTASSQSGNVQKKFTLRPNSICWKFTGADLRSYCSAWTEPAKINACLDYFVVAIATRGDRDNPRYGQPAKPQERRDLACRVVKTYGSHEGFNALGVNALIPNDINLGKVEW